MNETHTTGYLLPCGETVRIEHDPLPGWYPAAPGRPAGNLADAVASAIEAAGTILAQAGPGDAAVRAGLRAGEDTMAVSRIPEAGAFQVTIRSRPAASSRTRSCREEDQLEPG